MAGNPQLGNNQNENFEIKTYDLSRIRFRAEFGCIPKYPFRDLKVGEGFQINKMKRGGAYGAAKKFMQKNPDINIELGRDEFDNCIMIRTA